MYMSESEVLLKHEHRETVILTNRHTHLHHWAAVISRGSHQLSGYIRMPAYGIAVHTRIRIRHLEHFTIEPQNFRSSELYSIKFWNLKL